MFPADYREGMELDRTVRDILRKMTITDRLLEVNNRQLRSIGGDVLPNQVGLLNTEYLNDRKTGAEMRRFFFGFPGKISLLRYRFC